MRSSAAITAAAAAMAIGLAACGSRSDTAAETTSSSTTTTSFELPPPATDTAALACPTAAPDAAAEPEWTLSGATGSIKVTGSTDTAAPRVEVQAPFSVTETQVQTLKPGDGPVVSENATVLVCYMGVNGRDGSVFDSSYQRGMPVDFPLDGVVPGFQKAIAGQKVGSTVAVAMVPADGYPEGQPAAGIQPGDTLVFAIKILDATP
ncbi:FKBP-type peptidyl-prolyl cis-trans isomerase family protein [Mycolicibacterium hassiacum DSM 44199]|jgi:peptidylprolyl isomerase|uniref:Peptidyl-prolyl cis-trans isomerase n=1 Tax=Mycolicibacterium hassiacum (strain DSM 44199 / CIP 105218 / JCM 12690 / 3849) TaxID=1122247 RepID=K5B8H2_MYCHD|nr:FKBP-type peptidyl-prolyl cis-trans isomerase [Mycolicibacterium hassiacum]EKF23693.1 FKBP-type peptidyl-prolyl cis-trans isomerase family protein [Mycolicibacterium hassiacum DSM 44199]MBX5489297.1 FKBP-type peptidyl-prolyl cis-trans isomerase [Mycolicibacterium hassiacum]MDA4088685.1 peptidylprolyl isomerase [Mycolicibacterium hassiacum DSM 44199]VCT90229.1 putative FKBP-type peptidyl-prolyl cis-trans isomerase [Mycolicibacterium hassiacum DSM 44199]